VSETVDFGAANSGELSSALIAAVAPHKASAAAGLAINPGAVTLGAAATGTTINLLAEQTFSGTSAPQAGERDFLMLVGAGQLWLVDTSVAGWSIR
jgi:hypothetical protein